MYRVSLDVVLRFGGGKEKAADTWLCLFSFCFLSFSLSLSLFKRIYFHDEATGKKRGSKKKKKKIVNDDA